MTQNWVECRCGYGWTLTLEDRGLLTCPRCEAVEGLILTTVHNVPLTIEDGGTISVVIAA